MESVTLLELNQYIKQVLVLNFTEAFWLRAEIAQCRQSRGHYYMELVEKSPEDELILAQGSAVIWAGDVLRISQKLGDAFASLIQAGSEVQLMVEVTYHERYGLKLTIRDVDLYYTLGVHEVQRRKIIERLQEEKLLQLNKGLRLPPVLQRIAVISSGQAAGYQDFRHQLEHNPDGFRFDLELFPCAMQGTQVRTELLKCMTLIDPAAYDCIVIIRGGGSKLDLADFDDYDIGKAIAYASLPVLTGIGHEIDTSVADMVACKALKTPTAVAEFIIDRARLMERSLQELASALYIQVKEKLRREELALLQLQRQINVIAKSSLARETERLSYLHRQFVHISRNTMERRRTELSYLERSVNILDYRSVLSRGFALVASPEGRIVDSAQGLQTGDSIRIVLQDGHIRSTIDQITLHGKENQ